MAPVLIDKDGVKIVVQSREHLPPHIHASYGDDEALVNIRTGEIVQGYLPNKKLKVVNDWLDEGNKRMLVENIFCELNPNLRPKTEQLNPLEKKKKKVNSKNNKRK